MYDTAALKTIADTGSKALAAAKDPAVAAKKKAELQKACRMFEAHFLKLMMNEMRKTVPKGQMFHGGQGEEMFTSMLDQAVADDYTKTRSMGIAEMLEKQLSTRSLSRPIKPAGAKLAAPAGLQGQSSLQSPVDGELTSAFGPRVHPITGQLAPHQGVDLAAPAGSDVSAAADGQVVFAGKKAGYGNLVILNHADGRSTYYAHLSAMDVAAGQKVAAGETLGQVGQSGNSTGPHLHFEVRDAKNRPVDPARQLDLA